VTDAGISPDPAADDGADESSRSAPWPDRGADESSRSALGADHGAALSDEDLLALLDSLGVAGTHDPEEHQEAIADAEWEALQAYDFGADDEDGEGRAVSPVLVGEHLPAGPGLAAVLAQDPLAGASDWDLPGLAAGYRRLAAWAQARELSACAEIAARRAAANPKIGTCEDGRPASLPPEAAAEVGLELSMTQPGASAWTALACQLRWALPLTGDALAAGTIDLGRARIIADATVFLTRDHASQVEARVVPAAGRQTTGQLRAAVRRAVLAIDPDGAEQRQRDTERSAKLALYPGEEGTATLTGSCLPGLEAAAAMARITAMARALKSSGAHGGIDLLRANIFLGLLLGTLPLIPPPADGPPEGSAPADGPPEGPPPANGPPEGPPPARTAVDDAAPDYPPPGDDDAPRDCDHLLDDTPPDPVTGRADDIDDDDWPQLPPPEWPPLPSHLPEPPGPAPGGGGLARTGLLDVLIPWTALAGHSREPAILGRIGPISSWQGRRLLALATRSPATQWRVIITSDDGRALAVCRAFPPRHARTSPVRVDAAGASEQVTGVIGRVTITIRASILGTPEAAPDPACPLTVQQIAAAVLSAAARAASHIQDYARQSAAGGCAHAMASESYRPPPRIREHVAARDCSCRFGPCGQPAWRTDLDHTVPWHKGGATCPCNLGGCCRTHHKIKQLRGWKLEQPQPGIFRWTTPAGHSYLVQPDPYPV